MLNISIYGELPAFKQGLVPRNDGVWTNFVPTGGGADNRPRRSRKRRKLETSGKRHRIRADEIYNFY